MAINLEKIIRENIDKNYHLSLATANNNTPWVSELHFAYDDDLNLYFCSLPSRRHSQEIAANPRVAGNIVEQHPLEKFPFGIYFEGKAEMLKPGVNKTKAFKCLQVRLGFGDEVLEKAAKPDGTQFYKITVNNWYVFGKLDSEKGEKYQLNWKNPGTK